MTVYAVYEQTSPGASYSLVAHDRVRQRVMTWTTDPVYGRTRVILKMDRLHLPSSLLVRDVRKRIQQERASHAR